jgi:23S rRNA pseudouridine1911/1915/1917 synthase
VGSQPGSSNTRRNAGREPANTAPSDDASRYQGTLCIDQTLAGGTLLAALRKLSPDLSWSGCRKLLTSRRVQVNGVVEIHEARRLKGSDVVTVSSSPTAAPRSEQIQIVYADQELVVVDKPPHIVTSRRPEELHWPDAKKRLAPTLDELVCEALGLPAVRRGARRPPSSTLFRVQRLDRETSGLVVFARTQAAATGLIRQFREHTVERVYLAVVHGRPESQTISLPLVRDRGDGLRGQPAVTHVRCLQTVGNLSLVECRLETGRTHQIRIHLCELGAPVCGEPTYRHRLGESAPADDTAAPRSALHAVRLGFRHPRTDERLSFTAPWPSDLRAWLRQAHPDLLPALPR